MVPRTQIHEVSSHANPKAISGLWLAKSRALSCVRCAKCVSGIPHRIACSRGSCGRSCFAAFANGLESDKIVGMTAPVATKIFADRIGRIEVSATMAVTAEAARLRAQGAQLVDFGAGEPHFATPRHIKDAAIAAIESNFTRYTVVAGIPELRKAIVQRHACDFGSDYTADETVFTTGGKLALFNAIQVLVDHGDEVILPVPYWVSFKDIIQYAGGKVVYLPTEEAENFRVTADAIERAITPRTKVIILNTPSNPAGSVVSSSDLERIVKLAHARGNLPAAG